MWESYCHRFCKSIVITSILYSLFIFSFVCVVFVK
jgi:hypothetical protein